MPSASSQKPPTSSKKLKVCSSPSPQAGDAVEVEVLAMKRMHMRKVRVICTDPDATDSSSDEQEEQEAEDEDSCFNRHRHGCLKRVVREMFIPAACPSTLLSSRPNHELPAHTPASPPLPLSLLGNNQLGRSSSSKTSSKKWRLRSFPQTKPQLHLLTTSQKSLSRYMGVRQRKWSKWTAELCEPSNGGVRLRVGTFDIAHEAANTYDDAARQVIGPDAQDEAITDFDVNALPDIGMSTDELLSCSELEGMEECLFTAYSPSSVLDLPSSLDSVSPSTTHDISTYADESGSPLHPSQDVREHADNTSREDQTPEDFKASYLQQCMKPEPPSAMEPLFEAFGKYCDDGGPNALIKGNEFSCYDFPALEIVEDDGANLMSFELDAEALAWIDIQP